MRRAVAAVDGAPTFFEQGVTRAGAGRWSGPELHHAAPALSFRAGCRASLIQRRRAQPESVRQELVRLLQREALPAQDAAEAVALAHEVERAVEAALAVFATFPRAPFAAWPVVCGLI